MTAHGVAVRPPTIDDGAELWRLARSSGLDPNSAYYYLMFCRDFADTSVVATHGGSVCGFVTAYRRPSAPEVLFVWQVAVDDSARRSGIGSAMLSNLRDRLVPRGVRFVEASVTPSNEASARLFRALAESSGTDIAQRALFDVRHFPAETDHETEFLVRIGPFAMQATEPVNHLTSPAGTS